MKDTLIHQLVESLGVQSRVIRATRLPGPKPCKGGVASCCPSRKLSRTAKNINTVRVVIVTYENS